jgi:hypothetical protein
MINPILRITDGTTTVNLLDLKGWTLSDWKPAVAEPKGGGVFRNSPFVDGRKLSYRKMDNIIDTFTIIGSKDSQNDMIDSIQKLQRLLEKAVSYWITGWQNEPVWIEAKAANEGTIRYSTIVDYRFTGFGGPYQQPFFASDCDSTTEALLVIEHMIWQETVPSEDGNCVPLKSTSEMPKIVDYDSGTFTSSADMDDGYISENTVLFLSNGLYVGNLSGHGDCKIGIIFDNITVPVGATIISATLDMANMMSLSGYPQLNLRIIGQSQEGGIINSATVVSGGSGYVNPSVIIGDTVGGGSGAVAVATQIGGVITEITILDGGSGYTNPSMSIWDDCGRGADCGSGAVITATATPAGVNAATFDGTREDFLNRSKTDEFVTLTLQDGVAGWPPVDITDVIREILSNQYWSSGDKLGLFVEPYGLNTSGDYRVYYAFDYGSLYPELYIEWTTETLTVGRDTTCAPDVYVSNKSIVQQINYIFAYNAVSMEYSYNMVGWDYSSDKMPMFQTAAGNAFSPDVGDIIYFGSAPLSLDSYYGPFSSVVFDFYSVMENTEGVWEYYNGGWHEFDVTGSIYNELCGDNIGLMHTGVGSIVFKQPPDWEICAITDGIFDPTGFFIRFRVTAISGITATPYQWHRDIYTVVNPYIDIESEYVPGDIPALARIVFESAACWQRSMNTLVLGLRTLSRGENFSAYLNVSNVQLSKYMAFSLESTSYAHHIQAYTEAPLGYIIDLTGLAPITGGNYNFVPVCKWETNGNDYIGTYHAFVRCNFSTGGAGNVRVRLKALFGDEYNVSYSEVGSITLDSYICAVDLGQLSILPSFQMRSGETVHKIGIYLEFQSNLDSCYSNSVVYDVILIPADEWSGNFGMPKITGTSVLQYGDGLEVDGITTPRQYRAVQTNLSGASSLSKETNRLISAEWSRIASSEPIFQSNIDQRLWFFQYQQQQGLVSRFENCGAIRAERSARYILFRGNG